MKLKDFVPPVLWRLTTRPNSKTAFFADYAAAQAACAAHGYEEGQLIETIFQKTKVYREKVATQRPLVVEGPASPPLVAGLGAFLEARRLSINVLDVGGACGAHYFAMRAFLPPEFRLRWAVLETPAMVARARALAGEDLAFMADCAEARQWLGQPDLVHSSGTLPHVPKPYELLDMILAQEARYVVLSRLPLTAGESDFTTIHHSRLSENGPGPLPAGLPDGECRFPFTYLRQSAIERALAARYRLLLSWNAGVSHLGREQITQLAYLGKAIV